MALDPSPSLPVKELFGKVPKVGSVGTSPLTTCPSLSATEQRQNWKRIELNKTVKAQGTKKSQKELAELSLGAGRTLTYAQGPRASGVQAFCNQKARPGLGGPDSVGRVALGPEPQDRNYMKRAE